MFAVSPRVSNDDPDYDVPLPAMMPQRSVSPPVPLTVPASPSASLNSSTASTTTTAANAAPAAPSGSSPTLKRRGGPANQEKRKSIKDVDSHHQTLLHKNCFDGVYDDVEHLLRLQEININAQDKAGWTCLLSAACNGHWRICKLLLKNGADATIASFNGSSALHYLSKHMPADRDRPGYSKLFTLLIKRGASIAANSVGDTPLHSACSSANSVAVQLILAQWGHSVNLRNKADWTPFHFCAREGALDIAEMLIKRGADIDAKCVDAQRNTVVLPIDVARQSGRHAFVRMIEARRRDAGRLFKALLSNDHRTALAIVREHPHVACTLCPAGMAPNATADTSEVTTLIGGRRVAHWFAARNDGQSMRSLMMERAAPVDLNVLDESGRSPLHLACQYGDTKLIALLIENGASGGVLTLDGDSCMHILARRRPTKDKQWASVFKLLISAGANPTRVNKLGDCVLHLAALTGNEPLVRAVLTCPGLDLSVQDQNGRTALQCAVVGGSVACEAAITRALTGVIQ